jgi:hypothetical protein
VPTNASPPIVETPSGIVSVVIAKSAKAALPMDVRLLPSVSDAICVENAKP